MDQLHIFVTGSAVIAYICVGFGTFTQVYFNMTRDHAGGVRFLPGYKDEL